VIAMVLLGALWQVGIGLGIPLAVLAGKLMKDQLFGVVPWGPKRFRRFRRFCLAKARSEAFVLPKESTYLI
jgi:hypothetical protein